MHKLKLSKQSKPTDTFNIEPEIYYGHRQPKKFDWKSCMQPDLRTKKYNR
jgi:hypothetical protein